MSTSIIKVENLSKRFLIGHESPERYTTLRDTMVKRAKKIVSLPARMRNRQPKKTTEEFWALKNVDFEVQQGDRLGIIGRNGAGKSTLLKVLSRITEPTKGMIKIKGRVASLLEVGTGFHPELTGRENVYLNGAILGMARSEIRRKFDEIVSFAEVEKFLDTPVKRYSSGMYVRLAFAVAAHLEPEILIVDEVLAVGDVQFQKKCLGKMEDVSKENGRTVLFVSHNMGAITKLCNKAILLNQGTILENSTPERIISSYLSLNENSSDYVNFENVTQRRGSGKTRFKWAELYSLTNDMRTRDFSIGEDLSIRFCIGYGKTPQTGFPLRMSVELKSSDGTKIANMIDEDSAYHIPSFDGELQLEVVLKDLRLYPDAYYLSLYVGDNSSQDVYDYLEDCISFEIHDGGKLTTRTLPRSAGLLFYTPDWRKINKA